MRLLWGGLWRRRFFGSLVIALFLFERLLRILLFRTNFFSLFIDLGSHALLVETFLRTHQLKEAEKQLAKLKNLAGEDDIVFGLSQISVDVRAKKGHQGSISSSEIYLKTLIFTSFPQD